MSEPISRSRRKRLIRDMMEANGISRAEAVRQVDAAISASPGRTPSPSAAPDTSNGEPPDPTPFWRRR